MCSSPQACRQAECQQVVHLNHQMPTSETTESAGRATPSTRINQDLAKNEMPSQNANLKAYAIEWSVSNNTIPEVDHHDTISRMSQLLERPVGQIKVVNVAVAPQLLRCHTFLDLQAQQGE